jgi:predicted AlkP superfamily phosphohydrolase/phosphomutase
MMGGLLPQTSQIHIFGYHSLALPGNCNRPLHPTLARREGSSRPPPQLAPAVGERCSKRCDTKHEFGKIIQLWRILAVDWGRKMRERLLAIGLDGLEVTLAERLMAEGQMPALAELRRRSARFLLETEHSEDTDMPWAAVASGLSPRTANRWESIKFDPASYTAWQQGPRFAPWWAETDLRVVVFDAPHVDLRLAGNTQGIVEWGVQEPGNYPMARPQDLLAMFEQRFGAYPAREWMYANTWPSPAHTRLMGESLSHGLKVRSRAAQWLAVERFPEWDFFFAVSSELHAGTERLWHGLDARHPLHTLPSAGAAAQALVELHRELDAMVGQLIHIAGDAAIIVFNNGGMGPNCSDVPSMVLLPELLYRNAFGQTMLSVPPAWTASPDSVPLLDEHDDWAAACGSYVLDTSREATAVSRIGTRAHSLLRSVNHRLKGRPAAALRHLRPAATLRHFRRASEFRLGVDWMPCYRYRHSWPRMPAFALPSFRHGRIRINLRGRERQGIVDLSCYEETCQSLETLLKECRDPRTGEPSVSGIERASTANPLALGSSEADLRVEWRNVAAAMEHPRLGLVGPVPFHRTGGHSGPYGVAYVVAPGVEPGDRGIRSSFDVAATMVQLLGVNPSVHPTGESLLATKQPSATN